MNQLSTIYTTVKVSWHTANKCYNNKCRWCEFVVFFFSPTTSVNFAFHFNCLRLFYWLYKVWFLCHHQMFALWLGEISLFTSSSCSFLFRVSCFGFLCLIFFVSTNIENLSVERQTWAEFLIKFFTLLFRETLIFYLIMLKWIMVPARSHKWSKNSIIIMSWNNRATRKVKNPFVWSWLFE